MCGVERRGRLRHSRGWGPLRRIGDGLREFADWTLQDRTIGSYTDENRGTALIGGLTFGVGLVFTVVFAALFLATVSVGLSGGLTLGFVTIVLVLGGLTLLTGRFTLRQWLRNDGLSEEEARLREARLRSRRRT